MISKLILCYELSLEDLKASITFLKDKLKPKEILCLKPSELESLALKGDFWLYCFHLDLVNELKTHAQVTQWALKNKLKSLNPFLEEKNIFDDKYLFSQFLVANQIKHPKTQLHYAFDQDYTSGYILKARHGTEKRGFGDYSKQGFEEIILYDDVVVQEKIQIKEEIKVLFLNNSFYSSSLIEPELEKKLKDLNDLIQAYLGENKISIYSIDILKDKLDEYFFLELNLRPGALCRFWRNS